MRTRILGLTAALLLATACGKHGNFLYYLPQKDPDTRLAVNVKELHSAGGIDILWVIDNSPSMDPHQRNVIRNTDLFMQGFLAKRISWKMGLLSTSFDEAPYVGFDQPFDSSDPNPSRTFQKAVGAIGTGGDATEQTFDPIIKAFTDYPTFLRKDTPLAVLIVTDAPEQSRLDPAAFLKKFRTIVGDSRPVFVYPVLAATDIAPPGGCQTQEESFRYVGSPYEAFALNAKIGRAYSICDPGFGTNLGKIGDEIVQQIFRPEIRLGKRPKARSIRILFHGKPLPSGRTEDGGFWYYDHDRNVIVFYNLDFAQGDNEAVDIEFETDDGLPDSTPAPIPASLVGSSKSATDADTWTEFDFKLESPHDYPNGGITAPPIVIEGAKKLKVFFSRIATENSYDSVEIYDRDGKKIQDFTGKISNGFWSKEIPGDRCLVKVRADTSTTDWGFGISKIAAVF